MFAKPPSSLGSASRPVLHALPACVFALAGLALGPSTSGAQVPAATLPPSALANANLLPASAVAASAITSGLTSPAWSALSLAEQSALKPLANSWAKLSDEQKRKWISLSANFARLPASEQAKLHGRMAQWAALSPRQRELARLNFADAKQINPEEKSQKWLAYQALSAEEKQKLAKAALPKPPRTALAPQPVASDKIHRIPIRKVSASPGLAASASVTATTLPTRPKPPTSPSISASTAIPVVPVAPAAPQQ